jgi:hypothetical protein
MIVEVRPTAESQAEVPEEGTFWIEGRLVWDETVVNLCGLGDRRIGDERWVPRNADDFDPQEWADLMWIGDIFYTGEWCSAWGFTEDFFPKTLMQSAFTDFGLPEQACVEFTVDGSTYELCEPLHEFPNTYNWREHW